MGIITAIITTTIFLPIIASANCGRITIDNPTSSFRNDCGSIQLDGAGSPENGFNDITDRYAYLGQLDEMGLNSLYMLLHNMGGDGNDTTPYLAGTYIIDTNKLARWQAFIDEAYRQEIYIILLLGEGEYDNTRWHDWQQRQIYYTAMVEWFDRPNVLWIISEEIDGGGYRVPLDEANLWLEYMKSIAIQPVGQHNATGCYACFMAGYGANAEFVAWQIQQGERIESTTRYLQRFDKPVFISEGPSVRATGWDGYRGWADWVLSEGGNVMFYDGSRDQNLHDLRIVMEYEGNSKDNQRNTEKE